MCMATTTIAPHTQHLPQRRPPPNRGIFINYKILFYNDSGCPPLGGFLFWTRWQLPPSTAWGGIYLFQPQLPAPSWVIFISSTTSILRAFFFLLYFNDFLFLLLITILICYFNLISHVLVSVIYLLQNHLEIFFLEKKTSKDQNEKKTHWTNHSICTYSPTLT